MTNKHIVGKIRDAHGLKGELFVVLFAKSADWAEDLKELTLVRQKVVPLEFAQKKNNPPPAYEEVSETFGVRKWKPHKIGMIIQLEGITHRTQAEDFRGARVEIEQDLLVSKPGEEIFLKEVEGFEVFNGEQSLGRVVGFSSNGAQDILVVQAPDEKKVEVLFIEEFISEIQWKEKTIRMNLPAGMIELE